MTRVISINVNGIRASAKKGLYDWLAHIDADVICLQETKAQQHQLTDPVFHPEQYHSYFFDAEKKGYSGVALYCKQKPDHVVMGMDWSAADSEGRYLHAQFGDILIASIYFPSGTSGDVRQAFKYEFLDFYEQQLATLRANNQTAILCGDWNIAHKTIDLKNWKANQKNSGFLPEERAWMDSVFGQLGFVDAFRHLNQEPDQYTWWSNRGQAWAKNVGWRIDYQVISPDLQSKVKQVAIYKEQRFSDHAPLIVDYALTLDQI